MLKVIINNSQIDFTGSIPMRLLNPLFNDKPSYSLNIKTYNTPRNKDIIKQIHLPEANYNEISFPAEIITDAFVLKGSVTFSSVTDKYLDFQFISQNDFWEQAKTSLKNIDLSFQLAQYFAIKNTRFCDEFPIVNNYSGILNDPAGANITTKVPFFRLNDIVNSVFNSLNINVLRNDIEEHADLKQLYLYNNNSNSRYGKIINGFEGWFSFYLNIDGDNYILNTTPQTDPHNITVQGFVSLRNIITATPGVKDQLEGKVVKVTVDEGDPSILKVEDIVPVTDSIAQPSTGIANNMFFTGVFENSKNHLPEITCSNFLTEVERLTASKIFVDESNNNANIILIKNILKTNDIIDITKYSGIAGEQRPFKKDGYKYNFTKPQDEYYESRIKELTDLLTIKNAVATYYNLPSSANDNDVKLVIDENAYYRYSGINFLGNVGWEFYSLNNLPLQTGAGEYKIESKFSPLITEIINGKIYSRVDKVGKFICLNELDNDDFRLFFYRGIHNGTPLCTNSIYDHTGAKISTANLELKWDGTYGLHNQLHKELTDLMVNKYREEKRFINWPQWMLNSFAFWKKYRILHINYLVKSIDFEIFPDKVVMKDTELVPVN